MQQRALDELFSELEENADGLLDATLDDGQAAGDGAFVADDDELAGGFRTRLAQERALGRSNRLTPTAAPKGLASTV